MKICPNLIAHFSTQINLAARNVQILKKPGEKKYLEKDVWKQKNGAIDIWEMEAMKTVSKVSAQCVFVCACVPSSCIMTCSETTHSPSRFPKGPITAMPGHYVPGGGLSHTAHN